MNPTIRPLKESDIPDILEISKTTWNGHDHLPNIIAEWLVNPQCHPYVIDTGKEVIGVSNIRIIDEGKTAWLEGLRIHEKARQKGLAQMMTNHLCDIATQLRVDRLRLVTSGDNVAPMKLAKSIDLEQIIKYKVFWKGPISEVNWNFDKIELEPVKAKDIMKTLSPIKNLLQEEPNPYSRSIIYHWDVFEVSDINLVEIEKQARFHFGSNDSDAVLTIGGENPTSHGPEWCFTIYATSDVSFKSGLSKNLEIAKEKGINSIFCIHQPKYSQVYDSIEWLKERNHELSLILHERYLK